MLGSKHLNKIVAICMCLSLLACGVIVYAARVNTKTKTMDYETKLFGDEVLTIDIRIDEAEWQEMLGNATAKEYVSGDLVINGETFSTVGIRTKGNSSLTQVAQMTDSDRFSLHFKFNHFVKGQTCYGLDTFCVNNLMGDTTYMKDYLSYDIMKYVGVDTPLMNYANVTVNGEDFGFYLALERYEKSFLDRVYNTSGGQLYNVKIAMGQRDDFMGDNGNMGNNPMNGDNAWQPPDGRGVRPQLNRQEDAWQNNGQEQPPANWGADEQSMPGGNRPEQGEQNGGMGGFPGGIGGERGGMGSHGGGDLVYVDDEISSYRSIFDNAEFKKNSDKDKQRVIIAIKNLNAGTNLEKYFDVDEILRYLAAHTVVVNLDSYSSSMAQNYYIYERDGKISILPWDYNLAFGGFQSGNASSVVNFPIDTPVSGVSMEDRPLISKLLEVPEYKEKYHEYLQQLVDGYFSSGTFAETILALDAKIGSYVKNDTTSFTTYEAYESSLPVLIELGTLRAQSIEGQLNGTIPSTTEEQNANQSALVDASDINLSALGSMMGGMGSRGVDGNEGQSGFGFAGGMADQDLIQKAMAILQESGGTLNDEIRERLLESGLTEEQIEQISEMLNRMPGGAGGEGQRGNRGGFPGGNMPDRQNGNASMNTFDPTYAIVIVALLLILGGATFFLSKAKKTY